MIYGPLSIRIPIRPFNFTNRLFLQLKANNIGFECIRWANVFIKPDVSDAKGVFLTARSVSSIKYETDMFSEIFMFCISKRSRSDKAQFRPKFKSQKAY